MNAATFDILLIEADERRSLSTRCAIDSSMSLRAAQNGSGRNALASFQRARLDVIVCRPHLGDMPPSGWYAAETSGYAATPVIVLCDAIELQELRPMVDENTLHRRASREDGFR